MLEGKMPTDRLVADRAIAMIKGLALGNAYGQKFAFHQGNLPDNPIMALSYLPAWDSQISLAVCTLETTAIGLDLTKETTLNQLVYRYYRALGKNSTQIDSQTLLIISQLDPVNAEQARAEASYFAQRTRRANSAGLLCRVIPAVLAHLPSKTGLIAATEKIVSLTHADKEAKETALLLNLILREAIISLSTAQEEWRYRLDPFSSVKHLYSLDNLENIVHGETENNSLTLAEEKTTRLERGLSWQKQLIALRRGEIKFGADNGQCVNAFLQVLGTILQNAHVPVEQLFSRCLNEIIKIGGHTHITAAILGAVLGAALGERAFGSLLENTLHGWPGLDREGLTDLTLASIWAGLKGPKALQDLLKQDIDLREVFCAER